MLGEVEKSLKKTCGIMLPSTHRNLDRSASEASKIFFENDQLIYIMCKIEECTYKVEEMPKSDSLDHMIHWTL